MSGQSMRRRLDHLEAKAAPAKIGRVFAIYVDNAEQEEAERQRLVDEKGLTDDDTLIVVRWIDPEPDRRTQTGGA